MSYVLALNGKIVSKYSKENPSFPKEAKRYFFSLQDKVAVVTGAQQGVGLAISKKFVKAGTNLLWLILVKRPKKGHRK